MEPIVTKAATRAEAEADVSRIIRAKIESGELVELDIPEVDEPHPVISIVAGLKDHPDLAEVEENIREYRRRTDEDLP